MQLLDDLGVETTNTDVFVISLLHSKEIGSATGGKSKSQNEVNRRNVELHQNVWEHAMGNIWETKSDSRAQTISSFVLESRVSRIHDRAIDPMLQQDKIQCW